MKILVAEDDVFAASKLCNMLASREYEVIGPARKGAEALQLCAKEEPDLAILDWDLADEINGLQVAQELKAKFNIPVIFVTGRLDEEVKQQAIQLNAFAFINKPFNDRNLLNAIDLAISRFAETQQEQEQQQTETRQEQEQQQTEDQAYKFNDKIFVKRNGRYVKVLISDILFIEASRHSVIFHIKTEQVLANSSLSAMLVQVNHPELVRVHRSFAINIANIDSFDDAFVHFPTKSVPLSKSYKASFMKSLNLM